MKKTGKEFPLLPAVHRADGGLTDGALLLEGGSFRGIYTAGVCDVLMEQGIHFRCIAGVSAGALNGLNILSRQVGRFASICLLHRDDPRYTGCGAFLENAGLMGFRFLFHHMEKVFPNQDAWFAETERRLVLVATDCETGQPVYLECDNEKDLETASRASSSLALVSRIVKLNGRKLLDGGYSVSVPLDWAIGQGYKKRVAVLTREVSFRKNPVKPKTMKLLRRFYWRYPSFCEATERVPAEYDATRKKLEQQMKSGETFVIAPQTPVDISSMEKDTDKLYELYVRGRTDAEHALPALQAYLEQGR